MRRLMTSALALAVIGVGSLQAQTAPPPRPQPPTGAPVLTKEQTSTSTGTLGVARIPSAVTADGKTLPAGTYQVRLTTTSPPKVARPWPQSSDTVMRNFESPSAARALRISENCMPRV